MKKNNRTGSRLFFIEFLIVLFFFLIVSTVCLRMFARAHTITRRADALSHAQAAASSAAAVFENICTDPDGVTGGSDAQAILDLAAGLLPGAEVYTDGLCIFYDSEFQPCAIEEAAYALTAAVQPGETVYTLTDAARPEETAQALADDSRPEETAQTPTDTSQSGSQETGVSIEVRDSSQALIYELSASFHRPLTGKEALQQ